MKLLTVSIAGYNVAAFIRQTLDSLCCKNMERLEIFVVDDGGSDATLQIAQDYAKRYPDSIIPVHKDNGGWGSTVNYSIKHASGKYFKLLDGDDHFDTANLDLLLDYLEHADTDVIYTPYRLFDDKTGSQVEISDITKDFDTFKAYNLSELNVREGVEMHALTFKTSILQNNNVQVTEKCFYTDNEYRTKGLAFSSTIVFTDFLLYHYRVGREGQSIDVAGMRKHYKDSIMVARELIEFHKKSNTSLPPCVEYCVENAISFTYLMLILIKEREGLRKFDEYVKNQGAYYYRSPIKNVNLLRRMNFHCLIIISLMTKLRISLNPIIKKIRK